MNGPWALVIATGLTRLVLTVTSWWLMMSAERARARQVGRLLVIAGPGATITQRCAAGSLVVARGAEDA
jgi:hypothetical protein